MYTVKFFTITSLLLAFLNVSSYETNNQRSFQSQEKSKVNQLQQEFCTFYNEGKSISIITENGTIIENPDEVEITNYYDALLSMNRVRVTINSKSDNNLCSTELIIMDKSGRLEGNYSINNCHSYGWIFFTPSDCFDLALFHDAGSEAPFGNAVHGSVDWTFQFNEQPRISGSYMDLGAANMYKVASPCYSTKQLIPNNALSAKKVLKREGNLGL